MGERWKEIPGFPGYEASDQGRVRSYKKFVGPPDWWGIVDEPQRILSPSKDNNDYRGFLLSRDGEKIYKRAASLVMLAFVGPCPEGKEVCHNDGDSSNNRLDNLRYDTHVANMRDAIRHGGYGFAPKEIIEIRKLYAGDTPTKRIAVLFEVSEETIRHIGVGETYKIIGGPISKRTPGDQVVLTEDEVIAIRKARAGGKELKVLSKEYDRTESAVSRICTGRTYSQYGGPLTSR